MKRTNLKDFCDRYGQQKAADIMSCSQGNISQILKNGRREIFFEQSDDGSYSWLEIRRPTKSKSSNNQQEAKQ